jgi:Rad3-related DNA helicase
MLERGIAEIINEALVTNVFGKDFKFREGQREAIEAICNHYLQDPEGTIILDAPTGSGKSLIAMWSAHVLKELGKRGYLVTSDLMLQDQYEEDFKRLKLNWPSIRGVDNYNCNVNDLPFSLADCKMKGIGYEAAEKLPCWNNCGYLQGRKRAKELPVALFNYSYYLIQRNYVEDKMQEQDREIPFPIRDFVFFDEAHKVDSIVQSHFSPRIDRTTTKIFKEVNKFVQKQAISAAWVSENRIEDIVDRLMREDDHQELMRHISEFRGIAVVYRKVRSAALKQSKSRFKGGDVPKDWQTFFGRMDRLKDIWCKFDDYYDIIKELGMDAIVIDRKETETKFLCLEEAMMIDKFLQKKSGFKVFMSATLGDIRSFAKHTSMGAAKVIRMNNNFDYKKSPVVFVNRHKLSFREREQNLPKVIKVLDKILEKHKGQSGIIHAGSYQFMNEINAQSKHSFNFITYDVAKERQGAIRNFNEQDGKILVGPSLLEGLDLKDDKSRFQIFFKVPYPSLGDPLVKAKMSAFPGWYDWKTGIAIQQGAGRSIRSKDDWAITYILDACFRSLSNKKDFFPPSFEERIKTIY